MRDDTPATLGAQRVDEEKLRGHVDEVVRSSVGEPLNELLDAEADRICRAQRHEHSPGRVDTRAGQAAAEVLPGTDRQRRVVDFYRNVFSHVPNAKVAEVARMLKAI